MTFAPNRRAIVAPAGDRIDADDERRAAESRAERRAQADRALREDGDAVADAARCPLSAPEMPVEAMSGSISTCSSVSASGIDREVGPRVGHQQVLGPRAVDGVAEAPSAERPLHCEWTRVQAVEALSARRDGADDHPLADVVVALEARRRAPR